MYKILKNENINNTRSTYTEFVIERWNSLEEAGEWLSIHILENHAYTSTDDDHTIIYDEDGDEMFKIGDENLYIDNKGFLICKENEDPNSEEYKKRFRSILKL